MSWQSVLFKQFHSWGLLKPWSSVCKTGHTIFDVDAYVVKRPFL